MSKDKAREFWITVDDYQCLDAYWREPGGTFQTFHVIEHSAYVALEAKLAECVAALEFYGSKDNHKPYLKYGVDFSSDVSDDSGKRARECLAKVKK